MEPARAVAKCVKKVHLISLYGDSTLSPICNKARAVDCLGQIMRLILQNFTNQTSKPNEHNIGIYYTSIALDSVQ